MRLGVISQAPLEELAAEVRPDWRGTGGWTMRSMPGTASAAEELARQHGVIHRLISAQEQLQIRIAEVRERLGISASCRRPRNFRDKAR